MEAMLLTVLCGQWMQCKATQGAMREGGMERSCEGDGREVNFVGIPTLELFAHFEFTIKSP